MAAQYEYEFEWESSPLHEYEMEADPFFGKAFRRIGRVVGGLAKRAAPLLRRIAPMAARLVAGAIPGLGAIAGPLAGQLVSSLTQEQQQELEAILHEAGASQLEYEGAHPEYEAIHPEYEAIHPEYEAAHNEWEAGQMEWEGVHPEYESAHQEWESIHPEYESVHPEYGAGHPEYEGLHPEYESGLAHSEAAHQEAVLMEQIAHEATQTASEAEAEALVGALVPLAVRALRTGAPGIQRAAPALARATGRLVGALRRNPATRPLIGTVPTILRRTNAVLSQQAAQGAPVTPRAAVRTMANQTYRVISNPSVCVHILVRSGRLRRRIRSEREMIP